MRDSNLRCGPLVVKVGGSLFDLPQLGARLRAWLEEQAAGGVILVPGGGAAADVVRQLDRAHGLGEEAAHWLAVCALTLNAHFLHALLAGAPVSEQVEEVGGACILDVHAFLRRDEGRPGCLPHRWEVTSDAIAARVALVVGARELVLLKSVTLPAGVSWEEAARRGFVDEWFAKVLAEAPREIRVRVENWRAYQPGAPATGA
jgi:aspartokinase-like uncharacterized kinase